MGRTVPTYRIHLESILGSWRDYRRALRKRDREYLDEVIIKARRHASAASFCAHIDPLETALLSILLEMQKEIEELRDKKASNPRPGLPEGQEGSTASRL